MLVLNQIWGIILTRYKRHYTSYVMQCWWLFLKKLVNTLKHTYLFMLYGLNKLLSTYDKKFDNYLKIQST